MEEDGTGARSVTQLDHRKSVKLTSPSSLSLPLMHSQSEQQDDVKRAR